MEITELNKFAFIVVCALFGVIIGLCANRFAPQLSRALPSIFSPEAQGRSLSVNVRFSDHSYNSGIMKVAPSVVSLYSSETIYKAPVSGFEGESNTPVIAPRERRSTSQGSGVIIDSAGLVLTNWHLIKDADDINVVLSDGSLHQAQVIGKDSETDLAVVRIDAADLPFVEINPAFGLRVGDIVLTIGNPFGVGQTVTQGIVSATARRVAGASAWQNFVQIDAAINPGNSGGALISPDGDLVGINTAVFLRENGAEGIGFAIPVELLAQVVPQLIENGHVRRGWLGIGADDLQMFPGINREVDKGAVITAVLEGSPADVSGLKPYDVVITAANQPVDNATQLLLQISGLAPGTAVPLTVLRNGGSVTISVELLERPDFNQ